MKGQTYLEHVRDASVGSWLILPPVALPLQPADNYAADLLLMLHSKYPQLESQEMLDALEQAVWWLKLVTQAPEERLIPADDRPGEPRFNLGERTVRMLDWVLQEHAGERYDGSQLGLEVAIGLAAPRSHRHYPDGRPDCAACVFFGLVRRGAHE